MTDESSELEQLCYRLTKHMRENGVRRLTLVGSLEIELDPAAQYLPPPGGEAEPAKEDDQAERRAKGLCITPGCRGKGSWMNTGMCRKCGQQQLNGG